MRILFEFLVGFCTSIWVSSSFLLPIFNTLEELTLLNLMLVINNFFVISFFTIKSVKEGKKKNKDKLNFKIGSTKKNN